MEELNVETLKGEIENDSGELGLSWELSNQEIRGFLNSIENDEEKSRSESLWGVNVPISLIAEARG